MTAEVPIAVVTTVVGCALLILSGHLRRGVLAGPLGLGTMMLVAIFGIRPIYMAAHQSYAFYGLRVQDGVVLAATIGLVAVVAMYAGYGFAQMVHDRRRTDLDDVGRSAATADPAAGRGTLRPAAVVVVASVLGWFALMIVVGSGASYLGLLFAGRSEAVAQQLGGLPVIAMALPVVGCTVLAVSRVRIERARRLFGWERVAYWGVVALAVVPTSALGGRRFLLPCVLVAVLGALAVRWHRPVRALHVGIGAAALVVLAIFPFVRSAGSRVQSTTLPGAISDYYASEGVLGTIDSFFLSYDTEMFSYVSYAAPRMGDTLPFGWGRGTVLELLQAPLPASLLASDTWSNERLRAIFGGTCGEKFCPVPSLPGALYFDLALPGVILGMVLFGACVLWCERGIVGGTGYRLVVALSFGSFVPNVVRGNPGPQLAIMFQVAVVAVIVLAVIEAWHRRAPRVTVGVDRPRVAAERRAQARRAARRRGLSWSGPPEGGS